METEDELSAGGSESDFESDGALAHRRSSILGVLSRKLAPPDGSDGEVELLLEDFRKQAVSLLDRLCVTNGGSEGGDDDDVGGGGSAQPVGGGGVGGSSSPSASWMAVVSAGRLHLEAFQTAALAYLAPISGDASTAAAEKAAGAFDEAMTYLDEEVAETGVDAVDTDREALKEVAANIMIALGRLHASRQAAEEEQEADAAAVASEAADTASRGSRGGGSPLSRTPMGAVAPSVEADDGGETEYEDMLDADDGLSDEDSADFVDARSEPYEDDISSGLAAAAQGDRAGILSPSRRTTTAKSADADAASPFGGTPPSVLAETAAAREAVVPEPKGVRVASASPRREAVECGTPPLLEAACGGGASPPGSPPSTNAVGGGSSGGDAVAGGRAITTQCVAEELLNDAFGSDASDLEGGPPSGPLPAAEVLRSSSGSVTGVLAEVASPALAAGSPQVSAELAPEALAEAASQSSSESRTPLSLSSAGQEPPASAAFTSPGASAASPATSLPAPIVGSVLPGKPADVSDAAEATGPAGRKSTTPAAEAATLSAGTPSTDHAAGDVVPPPEGTPPAEMAALRGRPSGDKVEAAPPADRPTDASPSTAPSTGVVATLYTTPPPGVRLGVPAAGEATVGPDASGASVPSGLPVSPVSVPPELFSTPTASAGRPVVGPEAPVTPVAAPTKLATNPAERNGGAAAGDGAKGDADEEMTPRSTRELLDALAQESAGLERLLRDESIGDDPASAVDNSTPTENASSKPPATSTTPQWPDASERGFTSAPSPPTPSKSPAAVKRPVVTFCAARMAKAAAETDAFLEKALGDGGDDDALDDAGVDSSDDDRAPPVSKNTAGMLAAAASTDAFLETALDDDSGVHVDDTGVDSEAEDDKAAASTKPVPSAADARAETPVTAGESPDVAPRSASPAPPVAAQPRDAQSERKSAPLETFCAARMEQAATETDAFLDKALGSNDDDDALDDAGVDSSDDDRAPPVSKNTAGMLAAAASTDAFLETALDDDSGVHVDDTGVNSEADGDQPAESTVLGAKASPAVVEAALATPGESVTKVARANDDAPGTDMSQSTPPVAALGGTGAVGAALEQPSSVFTPPQSQDDAQMRTAAVDTDGVLEQARDGDSGAHVHETGVDSEQGGKPKRLSLTSSVRSGSSATGATPHRALSPPGSTGSSGQATVAVGGLSSSSPPASEPRSSSTHRAGSTSPFTSGGSTLRSPDVRNTAAEEADEVAAAAAGANAYLEKALAEGGEDVDDTGVDSDADGSQASGGEARERSMAAAAAEADAFLAQALGDDDDADVDDTGVDSDAAPSEDVQPEAEERSMAAAAAEADAFLEMALGDDGGANVDDTGVNSDAEQEPTNTTDRGMVAAAAEANAFLEKALGDDGDEDVDDTGVNSDTEPVAETAGSGSRALASSSGEVRAESSSPSGGGMPSVLNRLRGFAHSLANNAATGTLGSIAVAGAVAGGVDIDSAKKKLSDLDVLLGIGPEPAAEDDGFEDFEAASSEEEGAGQWGEASDGRQGGGGIGSDPVTPRRSSVPSDASSSPLFGSQASPKPSVSMQSYGARRFGGGPESLSLGVPPASVTLTVWPPGDGGCQEHSNVPLSGSMLQSLAAGAMVELTPRHVVVDAIFMGMGSSGGGSHGSRSSRAGGPGTGGGKDGELLGVLADVTRGHIERLLKERNETAALLEAMINEHCKAAGQLGQLRAHVDNIAATEKQGREPLPGHCGFSVSTELAALCAALGACGDQLSTVNKATGDGAVLEAEREKAAAAASAAKVAELQAALEASAARIAELEAAAAEAAQAPPSDTEETRRALEEAEATVERLTADMNRASNQRNAMRLQCRQTQAALDRMMASNNQERSKMQSRLLKLQRIADTAQYEVDRAVRDVQATADEAVAAKASAESELQTLLVTHGTMCRNFVELEEELLQLRKDHSALKQAQEMATAVARMNGENAKIATSQAELVAAEASDNARKLAVQLHEARREAASARADAEASRASRVSGFDASHDTERSDAAQVTRLQANAEALQTSLTAALQVSDKYKEQLRSLQERADESERSALHARKAADMANGRLAGEDVVTEDQVTAAALTEEVAMLKKQHQQRILELESLLCTAETALSTSASKRLTESRMASMAASAGSDGSRRPTASRLGDRQGEEPRFVGFGRDRSSSPASAASSVVDSELEARLPMTRAASSICSIPDVDVESEDGDRSFGGGHSGGSFRSDTLSPAQLPPPIVTRGMASSSMAFSPVSAAVALPSLWRSQSVNVDFAANDVSPSPRGGGSFQQRSASIYSPEEVSPALSPASPDSPSPTTATAAKPPPAAAATPPPAKGGRMFKRLGYKLRFNSHSNNH